MIIEPILIIFFAFVLDWIFGDPKNRYHPTAWIGWIISKITIYTKTKFQHEKINGIIIVLVILTIVITPLFFLGIVFSLIDHYLISTIFSIIISAILLKTTIAIKGMEQHAMNVVSSLKNNDLISARNHLSMIVKRDTKNLDENHIISGVMESVSENTVDGITGPLFYYSFFGLYGSFVYRTINTIDSMIGYKTTIFENIGWFGANCDRFLNFIPARLTGFLMILSSALLGYNWKNSYHTMLRDRKNLPSPNAGYPIAALAGALDTKLEKINYYKVGMEKEKLSLQHIIASIRIMKLTSIFFCFIICIPIIIMLSSVGWWINV